MACNDCPELNPNPNEGCLQPINSSCVTYDGNDVDCADIASGQTISQVIETLANNDCELQEQIEDIVDNMEELSGNVNNLQDDLEELSGSVQTQIDNIITFTCQDLSGCSIDNLLDVDVSPVSGDSLIYNGIKWINYTPEDIIPYEFTCEELSGCTLDELSGIAITNPVSGDVLIHNGNGFINYPINQLLADLQNSINVLNSQVEIQNNAITLLTIRMDDCSCPTGSALDVSFSDARLNLCTQNTTTGKFIVYLTFAGSGTDLDSVEGVTLITVNVPDAVNPTLSVTPTTIPDSSPTAKSFNLLSGMKAELVTGGSGGTITFTVKFIDTSTIVHYANITFTIPDFDTSGDNCDNELTPSSVTFDEL